MRILTISNYYPPFELGGWEQLTRDVVAGLRERGHVVRVVTSNHRQDEAEKLGEAESETERILHLQSADHVHYHAATTFFARWREAQNRRALSAVVEAFQPDVVFINGMWNLSHHVARHLERLLPDRVAYYMASPWPIDPNAHRAFWQDPAGSRAATIAKKVLGTLFTPLFVPSGRRNGLQFRLVMTVSGYMRRVMIDSAKIDERSVQIVHNGIEPDLFVFQPSQIVNHKLRLLYAGQVAEHKGVHTAVEAMVLLAGDERDVDVELTIIGGGPPEYLAALKSKAADAGLNGRIIFKGQVQREAMPSIMAAHDVLVFPSVWNEPLSRVVQEAMASGLVVIGTRTGGTPEILDDKVNGLLFSAEAPNELADRINYLAESPERLSRLAQNARTRVLSHFTMVRMVDEIEKHLESLK